MSTQIVRSPVYQQLNERLRATLSSDYYRGDQFLTEREISERPSRRSARLFSWTKRRRLPQRRWVPRPGARRFGSCEGSVWPTECR